MADENELATKGDLRDLEKRLEDKIDRVDEKVDRVEEKVNRVGVLVENLEGKVRVLAEGHDALNAKVDALSAKFDGLEHRIISELTAVIRSVSNGRQVDDLAGRVTVLEHDVAVLKKGPPTPPSRREKAAR